MAETGQAQSLADGRFLADLSAGVDRAISRQPNSSISPTGVELKAISIQVQPDKAPGIDIPRLTELFTELASRTDLVRNHAFDSGEDDGTYLNFTFGTEDAAALWFTVLELVYEAPEVKAHMASASMAMCSSESGWGRYVQLFHWDPLVPVVAAAELRQFD